MRAYIAVALVCALLSAGSLAAADRAKDEAAIREVVEQVNTIHNRHEVEPLVALFDKTVENWTGARRSIVRGFHGRSETRGTWAFRPR